MNDSQPKGQYTEPLSVSELAVFLGSSWKLAKQFLESCPERVQVGSAWQLPIWRMPPAYFAVRSCPISSDFATLDERSGHHMQGLYGAGMQPYLSERDTAIWLRTSLADLNDLVESGRLPFISAGGGEIRFEPEAVMTALRTLQRDAENTNERGKQPDGHSHDDDERRCSPATQHWRN